MVFCYNEILKNYEEYKSKMFDLCEKIMSSDEKDTGLKIALIVKAHSAVKCVADEINSKNINKKK